MIVLSWNVLHRIHAVNWSEPVATEWPDEGARCGSIADFISASDADVICLQECSGDQLAMLRDVERGELFATKYPRVPAYKRPELRPMRDGAEYLVTIVRDLGAQLASAETFASDGGKGFQRVELATGVNVINAHVSFGDKGVAQLKRIGEVLRAVTGPVIVCGDFNAARATCMDELGNALVPAVWPLPSLPTRPRQQPSDKSMDIDHVLVRGGEAVDASVLDGETRSDHNPVRARFRFASVG